MIYEPASIDIQAMSPEHAVVKAEEFLMVGKNLQFKSEKDQNIDEQFFKSDRIIDIVVSIGDYVHQVEAENITLRNLNKSIDIGKCYFMQKLAINSDPS